MIFFGGGKQDPVSQPGRKQVLVPVVLLSHYASSRRLKVEPAPVNIPPWLVVKETKEMQEREKRVKHCGEIECLKTGRPKEKLTDTPEIW